jgi:hypothetical protein
MQAAAEGKDFTASQSHRPKFAKVQLYAKFVLRDC